MIASEATDLTMDELVSNTAITFFGGLETTASLLSNTLWCLLTHPADLARLQADAGLWANAVEEVLRWEAPVQTAHRLVKVDTAVGGIPLRAGQMVQCMLSAANRDPRLFTQPDRFDIDRANAAKHLSFARGPHFCFGAPLARLEAMIALPLCRRGCPTCACATPPPGVPSAMNFAAHQPCGLSGMQQRKNGGVHNTFLDGLCRYNKGQHYYFG